MATYHQMLAQIAELQEAAAAQRAQELAQVIATMKANIREFGLSAKDLGFKSLDEPGSVTATRPPRPPKYREPKTGAVWSGMGKPPLWISGAANRDKFLIAAADASDVTEKPAAKKSAKQAAAPAVTKKAAKPKASAAPAKKAPAKKAGAKRGASASQQASDAGTSAAE